MDLAVVRWYSSSLLSQTHPHKKEGKKQKDYADVEGKGERGKGHVTYEMKMLLVLPRVLNITNITTLATVLTVDIGLCEIKQPNPMESHFYNGTK